MSFTVHGIDGFLFLFAVLCFLVATIFAWVAPGHRFVLILISAGLFFATLTHLVH